MESNKVNQIFISYRRSDTAGAAGRIYDRLVQRFGKSAVFKDVDSIPLGVNFKKHLDSVVQQCSVVLVIIGDRWLERDAAAGQRRIDDPRDFVGIEIESALRRDIPVIPLLVENASVPTAEELPSTLQEFAYRQGMVVGHDPQFHTDVDRLIKHLESLFGATSNAKDQEPEANTARSLDASDLPRSEEMSEPEKSLTEPPEVIEKKGRTWLRVMIPVVLLGWWLAGWLLGFGGGLIHLLLAAALALVLVYVLVRK